MQAIQDHQFHALLDGAPDGVLVESGERVLYVNDAYARLLGYTSPADLESATIRDIAHPEEVERLEFGVRRREGHPAPTRYSFRACARQGDLVTLDASISTTMLDGELLITTLVRALAAPTLDVAGAEELSPREREVIEHLLAGRRSKEIALLLDVSDKTVFTHRSRAFAKLGVNGVGELFSKIYPCAAKPGRDLVPVLARTGGDDGVERTPFPDR
jgi:PAS domain S-box-containing protein